MDATVGFLCRTCLENDRERLNWGDGPWKNEPNRAEWEHAGLPCIAHRGGAGAWCGYVGVPPGHPFHGKGYEEIESQIGAHGGLTYAEKCAGHICHVAKPGEPDDVWWFGFDCAHAGDLMPSPCRRDLFSHYEEHYWTLAEVQEETNRLAEQLVAIMGHHSVQESET